MPSASILFNCLFRWSVDYSIDYDENDRFESSAVSYILYYDPYSRSTVFSRWAGFMACGWFVFALAAFRESRFIWNEPFYSDREDYYDYPYWWGFPDYAEYPFSKKF